MKHSKITKAYDPWANGVLYVISPGKLTYNSKEAKLYGAFSIAWKGFPAGSTFKLTATIKGNNLETRLTIP